ESRNGTGHGPRGSRETEHRPAPLALYQKQASDRVACSGRFGRRGLIASLGDVLRSDAAWAKTAATCRSSGRASSRLWCWRIYSFGQKLFTSHAGRPGVKMLQSKPVRNLASLTCVVTLLVAQRLDASGASVAGPGRSNLEPASANLASAVSPGATTNKVEQTAPLLMRAPVPAPPQGTPTEKVPPGRSRRPPRPTSTPAPTPTSPAPPGTAI